ncbi:hypothetical protein EDB83DRAFT_699944, partial [Lactarius deliciosus]
THHPLQKCWTLGASTLTIRGSRPLLVSSKGCGQGCGSSILYRVHLLLLYLILGWGTSPFQKKAQSGHSLWCGARVSSSFKVGASTCFPVTAVSRLSSVSLPSPHLPSLSSGRVQLSSRQSLSLLTPAWPVWSYFAEVSSITSRGGSQSRERAGRMQP